MEPSKLSVAINPAKKQKCFTIDPVDGTSQYSQVYAVHETEETAISKLKLWQKVGVKDDLLIDQHHAREEFTKKAFEFVAKKRESSTSKAILNDSLLSAQRASIELAQLVELSSILKANKLLTLNLNRGHKNVTNGNLGEAGDPQTLPLSQIIQLKRKYVSSAKSILGEALQSVSASLPSKSSFANGLCTVAEQGHFKLCSINRETGRLVTARKFLASKDCPVIDCEISENDSGSAAFVRLHPINSSSVVSGFNVRLEAAESNYKRKTLFFELIFEPGVNSEQGIVFGRCNLWDSLERSNGKSDEMELDRERDPVAAMISHCRSRKHESLCHCVFSALQADAVESSSAVSLGVVNKTHTSLFWDVLSDSARSNCSNAIDFVATPQNFKIRHSGRLHIVRRDKRELRLNIGTACRRGEDADTNVGNVLLRIALVEREDDGSVETTSSDSPLNRELQRGQLAACAAILGAQPGSTVQHVVQLQQRLIKALNS